MRNVSCGSELCDTGCAGAVLVSCGVSELCVTGCEDAVLVSCVMCHVVCLSCALLAVQMLSFVSCVMCHCAVCNVSDIIMWCV